MGTVTLMTKSSLTTFVSIAERAASAHIRGKGLPQHLWDDLYQEGLLWLLDHPQRVQHATFGDGEIYGTTLVAEIRRHYVTAGTDRPGMVDAPFIESKYTPGMVSMILPAVYDPEYQPFRERTEGGERFARMDPSESGNWQALVADVSRAVDALGRESEDMRYVFRHDVLGESYATIGQSEGVGHTTAHARVKDTLEWMAHWLNGDFDGIEEPSEQ